MEVGPVICIESVSGALDVAVSIGLRSTLGNHCARALLGHREQTCGCSGEGEGRTVGVSLTHAHHHVSKMESCCLLADGHLATSATQGVQLMLCDGLEGPTMGREW